MSSQASPVRGTITVVAVIEATTVTGPAKNLIEFCRRARLRDPERPDIPLVEVSIACFHRGSQTGAPNAFVETARQAGLEVDVIRERFRFDLRVLAQLSEVLARRQPAIVQTHNIKAHFLLKLSGLARRHRWIAFHHGYTAEDLKMRVYNSLNRWSLPSADRVVTVCQPFVARLMREGVAPGRIRVLHNSISTALPATAEETAVLRRQLASETGARVLVAVGRMSREKGHLDLIRALELLRRRRPILPFRLVLVGEGPEQPRLERAIAAADLGEQVWFAGQQRRVGPFYAVADALVLPSHTEGSPNVLLEAISAGVPIVATAVGGVPEIVRHEESALLVQPRDPEALCDALRRLLEDKALARTLAANALRRGATQHSPDAYRRALVAIYEDLLPVPLGEASPVA